MCMVMVVVYRQLPGKVATEMELSPDLPCQSEFQLEEMMRWGDKDGDGKVGAQEFTSMMMEVMRKQMGFRH